MRARILLFLAFLFSKPLLFATTIIIGIAGASGAGKTTLANKLKEELGADVTIIRQDNYYKDQSHLPVSERAKTNFDAPDSIDFKLLHSHLRDLKDGKVIFHPLYSFKSHNRLEETVKITPTKILIVEGSLLLAIPEIRNVCDMKLFIDLDMDICLCRRIERDQIERGRHFTDIKSQYLKTVRPMFLKHVAPSRSHADLIIPNETKNGVVLDFITTLLTHQTFKGQNDV